jgi:putative SOS response-associated peptidase YedK
MTDRRPVKARGNMETVCGRFTLTTPDWDTIRALLDALPDPEEAEQYRPRFNIAPSDAHPIARLVDGKRRLSRATWGLPGREHLLINARAESIEERPRFRDALRAQRCVVPADGFYEWKDGQPFWYHAPDGGPLFFAGLWEDGPERPRFVILTTAANELVAAVHDRMPAIVAPSCIAEWLARPALELIGRAAEQVLRARPVSPRVGSTANDDRSLLDAVKPRSQLSLF